MALFERLPRRPVAFGANCGTGPGQLLATVLGLQATPPVPTRPLVAKGNCGIPEYRDGHICYSGTPEIMADYARLARDCGARIIGGCCGTTRGACRGHAPCARHGRARVRAPDLPTIAAALGPVVLPTVTGASVAERERGERRRRRA